MTARLWGQMTLVNTNTSGTQDRPAIATLADGNLIVVWRDAGQGSGDIMGQLFDPLGRPIGGQFLVEGSLTAQAHPAVAALANGNFVVAYEDGSTVSTREYTAAGQYVRFTTISSTNAARPAVAALENFTSGFNIAFSTGVGVGLARYDQNGAFINTLSLTVDIVASTTPDIAPLVGNRVAVAWREGAIIAARTVDAAGVSPSAIIYVSSASVPGDTEPKVTPLAAGAFLVAWHATAVGYPGSLHDIRGCIVDGNGNLVGPGDFLINANFNGNQRFPEIVALKNGAFMALWHDLGSSSVRGQVFDPLGGRVGQEFTVSTSGLQYGDGGLEATLMADGRVAVVWHALTTIDGSGVFMQIVDPRDGVIEGSTLPDALYGHDTFEDVILGFAGSDTIYGLGGNDAIHPGDGGDTVYGGTGDDTVSAGAGNDLVSGDEGNDLLYGGLGEDTIAGGAGADLIFGETGNDWIEGGADNDTMLGSDGGDRLEGQDGNDVMDGGIGNDVLIGGAGNDIYYVDTLGDQVVEASGGGTDIVYSSAGWLGNANVENLVLTGSAALNATMNNDANLIAGNGAANVINGAGGNDVIDGLGGIDWLGGGEGADRLDGGADNDTIQGGVGADALYGGSGADSFYYGSYLDSNATQGIDSIQDFQVGVDKINLTPARLSASDSATIVYAYGNAYVFADLYGDGINDMIIEVIGATTLSGTDLSFVAPATSAIYYGDDAGLVLAEAEQAGAHHRASWDAMF